MRIAHWTILNKSGMHRVAESLAAAERTLGMESAVCDPSNPETWAAGVDADVHVCHTHIPDAVRHASGAKFKYVYVGHGTPEHIYHTAVRESERAMYGASDALMLLQHHLKHADARVTFWPRHAAIYRTMLPKEAIVDCLPLGVELAFWRQGGSAGKFVGAPSVLTAENQHPIKWVLDAVLAWPWVTAQLPDATLHAPYTPQGMHRTIFPLANANGAAYKAYLSPVTFDHANLRNAFQSTDFFLGLVRYGDHNRLCLEANAAGATTISYTGNPYADYWVPEGDQRVLAEELVAILSGQREKREKSPVPDITETAQGMVDIYQRIA